MMMNGLMVVFCIMNIDEIDFGREEMIKLGRAATERDR